jgi:hypothetical protein
MHNDHGCADQLRPVQLAMRIGELDGICGDMLQSMLQSMQQNFCQGMKN